MKWRRLDKLHNEELYKFYSLPNIIRKNKSRRMGKACSMNSEKRNAYRILTGKSEGKSHLEDQDVGGWIILNRT
jgi:hypothetical protein